MTTIYLVECGEYSGRYVAAAFVSEDVAYAYAYANEGYVGEIDLDSTTDMEELPILKRPLRPGERRYYVRMKEDGNGAVAEVQPWLPISALRDGDDASFQESTKAFITDCFATSPEQAIKIANERRTGWLIGGKRVKPNRNNQYWMFAVY